MFRGTLRLQVPGIFVEDLEPSLATDPANDDGQNIMNNSNETYNVTTTVAQILDQRPGS